MHQQHIKTSAIILAGGQGTRMQESLPKQYLSLGSKPVARHCFDIFIEMPEITEIVVVCDPSYRNVFAHSSSTKQVLFALPGKRRQDSVYNGLLASTPSFQLVCVHDAARPFIDRTLVNRALEAGQQWGAATVGLPIKFTVKESTTQHFVHKTPDRSLLWEIQTPQVLHRDIISEGFRYAQEHNITVTDDVSLAELVGKQVKLIEGSHENFKITVPVDLMIAQELLRDCAKRQ